MEQFTRRDYAGEGITGPVPSTPWAWVQQWVDDARRAGRERADVPEPDSLSVATVDPDGRPSVRTVLLRRLDPQGPGFFTNLHSRKGQALRAHPQAAATLTWPAIYRAIRFEGVAQELDREEVRAYFDSRPWGSRVGAWASEQSAPITDRGELEARVAELEQRWPDRGQADDVPLPDFWGGYLLHCDRVELWAGRRSRLHDRVVWTRDSPGPLDEDGAWEHRLLQP
ncbi:pyridoxamine 5'-phosphate oxidase [Calidifontibacter sp. DB0510]|uniref:Pyridoxamine 5'-phosphate oxidase n=1 Tax=Metallococcus carri TaxID=1656884 RepID=A0A967EGW5_9MICO|nr:pyridoxamine 5'-phosphate oxidase [Metallococcus carri]NHN55608.1 pyridoxamine 5'-phosphate oxidase [Metallococcus carri]NOP38208.1 pyridoxamine 5'-phosphate oxidase [Calidifontibacter sp. DB2511S]